MSFPLIVVVAFLSSEAWISIRYVVVSAFTSDSQFLIFLVKISLKEQSGLLKVR